VGTAFGVSNRIELASINTIIAKTIHRTDMMVDISQLHENHLNKLDNMIKMLVKFLVILLNLVQQWLHPF